MCLCMATKLLQDCVYSVRVAPSAACGRSLITSRSRDVRIEITASAVTFDHRALISTNDYASDVGDIKSVKSHKSRPATARCKHKTYRKCHAAHVFTAIGATGLSSDEFIVLKS